MKCKQEKRTKRISILIALGVLICTALTCSVFASEPSGVKGTTCYTHGDINADGSVTSKDAIQLLYYATIGDGYSVDQDVDFEKDGEINAEDAIHLLYSVNGLFGELLPGYALDGVIHAYDEPIWVWDEQHMTVTASYRCACGEMEGVVHGAVEIDEEIAPTCTEAGSVTCLASATFADVTYGTTKTFVKAATGHNYLTASCTERECQNPGCDYIEKASGHDFGEPQITAATCTTAEIRKYVCEDCSYEYEEQVGEALGHTLDAASLQEILVNKDTCEYKQVYTCSTCQQEVEGELVHKHSYVATITKEATCMRTGTKTYECSQCGDTGKTSEEIPVNAEAHQWKKISTKNDITTYSCTQCRAQRTTVNASKETETTVSKETLASAGEVEVNNAAIKMDEATLNQLDGEVKISVEVADKNTLGISDDEKEQIGSNPVYDFSLSSGQTQVSQFDGYVTVTLPYTLQPEDDADCIDVWFINDNGTVEVVKGVYSNKYVTFTTNHFSYYTVTRLTPEQRCAVYGHDDTTQVVKPTCEADGYTLAVCVRCARTEKINPVSRLGHNYKEKVVPATCEADGSKTETCAKCKDVRTTVLPKQGHAWKVVTNTQPTCSTQGEQSSVCETCKENKTEVLPQLSHSLEDTLVEPTCDAKGYTLKACTECDYKVKENEVNALGHEYKATWNWVEDEGSISATLSLTCEHDEAHSVVKDAVLDISKQVLPTCKKDGSTTYTAIVSYNQISYEEEYLVIEEKYDHKPSEVWEYNAAKHYQLCTLCGEKALEEEHSLDDGTVIKKATCLEDGAAVYTCACGYKTEEAIPSLGHEIVDASCTRCDFTTNECKHGKLRVVEVEFTEADGVCPGTFVYETCDCGEIKYYMGYERECEFEFDYEQYIDSNGYVRDKEIRTCINCEMVFCLDYWWEISEGCTGEQHEDCYFYTKDNILLQEFHSSGYMPSIHPTIVASDKTVDMKQYGLCGGTITELHCVCGEATGLLMNDECEWEYDPMNSDSEETVYNCSTCGGQMVSIWSEDDVVNCEEHSTTTRIFYKDGEELVRFETLSIYQAHEYEYEFDMDGDTCSDGYTVTSTCKNCDKQESRYQQPEQGEHNTYGENIDLPKESTCGGYIYKSVCPCGEKCYIWDNGNCMMEGRYGDGDETEDGYYELEHSSCDKCELNCTVKSVYTNTDLECTYDVVTYTTYSIGETKFVEGTNHEIRHSDEYTICSDYKLLKESCEDGVIVTEECTACGEVRTQEYWGHTQFSKEQYNLDDYGLCGGTVSVRGCLCGQEEWIAENGDCEWNHWKYDSKTNTSYYKCLDCGMTKLESYQEQKVDGCLVLYTTTYEYLKGYNVVLSVESNRISYDHNYEYQFILNKEGGTCSDGYTVHEVCKDCEVSHSYNGSTPEGMHSSYKTKFYDLTEYGFCGGSISLYECPCGGQTNINNDIHEYCEWHWYGEEAGVTKWKCSECGNIYSQSNRELDADGCTTVQEVAYKFCDKDMKELLSVVAQTRWQNHEYEYTYELQGTSCSDGYKEIYTCKNCEYKGSRYEQPPQGEHFTHDTQNYDLREYGFCGGSVREYSCPCGEETGSHVDYYGYCNWSWYKRDEATNTTWYQCLNCHNIYSQQYGDETVEGCYTIKQTTYKFYDKDLNEKLSVETQERWSNHETEYRFELEGTSCTDGYTVYETCKICDYQDMHYVVPGQGEHALYTVKMQDLTDDGFCGGYIYYQKCPCGKEESNSWEPACSFRSTAYDAETHTHTYSCSTCGGYYTEKTEETQMDVCHTFRNTECHIYNKVGVEVYNYISGSTYETHDYLYTYRMNGESCEDGYYVDGRCRYCGAVSEDLMFYTNHSCWNTQYVDLSTIGLCGGEAVCRSCPCGQEESWNYNESCQWDNWEVVDGVDQYTCDICETKKTSKDTVVEIDDCHERWMRTVAYIKNDTQVWEATSKWISQTHDCVYDLTLITPGTTCAEGVLVHGICATCGYVDKYEICSHSSYCTNVLDLTEFGMCPGSIKTYQCACEEEYWKSSYDSCEWIRSSEDEAGVSRCPKCNASRKATYIDGTYTFEYFDADGNKIADAY